MLFLTELSNCKLNPIINWCDKSVTGFSYIKRSNLFFLLFLLSNNKFNDSVYIILSLLCCALHLKTLWIYILRLLQRRLLYVCWLFDLNTFCYMLLWTCIQFQSLKVIQKPNRPSQNIIIKYAERDGILLKKKIKKYSF